MQRGKGGCCPPLVDWPLIWCDEIAVRSAYTTKWEAFCCCCCCCCCCLFFYEACDAARPSTRLVIRDIDIAKCGPPSPLGSICILIRWRESPRPNTNTNIRAHFWEKFSSYLKIILQYFLEHAWFWKLGNITRMFPSSSLAEASSVKWQALTNGAQTKIFDGLYKPALLRECHPCIKLWYLLRTL